MSQTNPLGRAGTNGNGVGQAPANGANGNGAAHAAANGAHGNGVAPAAATAASAQKTRRPAVTTRRASIGGASSHTALLPSPSGRVTWICRSGAPSLKVMLPTWARDGPGLVSTTIEKAKPNAGS